LLRTRSAGDALAELRRHGVSSVLIEGGPRAAATFLAAGLVDEVISYVAPVVLGAGSPAVADLGINTISEAVRGLITDVEPIGTGTDLCVRITARLTDPDDPTSGAGHGPTHSGGIHVHRDH
jgi:diaminohydroxyphosphoribosylaminopyrimidine deaminase/5-amino-6-(5-phosphoribosylamino)uracil reductase